MKNLLEDIGLERGASGQALDEALQRHRVRDTGVLDDPLRLEHYERVHLQYEAIAAACHLLPQDGHRWSERSIEFVPLDHEEPEPDDRAPNQAPNQAPG